MKKLRFNISVVVLSTITLTFSACAEKDAAEENKTGKNNGITTTFFSGNDETASAKTRTSLDYAAEKWFWEAGDKIYVKDRDGNWQVSNAVTAHTENFAFKLPGMYSPTGTMVYYLGKNGTNDQITIPTTQNQTNPNAIDEISNNGECGVAEAVPQWKADGLAFKFKLKHQAAILVLQPYTTSTVLHNCKLTKIEIISDNDIAGTFTLSSLGLTGAGSKSITVNTKSIASGSSFLQGFPLTNNAANLATNGVYTVIKPGTHALKVRYWVKDLFNGVEGKIAISYPAFNYTANGYYDLTAPLTVKEFDDKYYMWGAQKDYWWGHESDRPAPGNPGENYPQSKAQDPLRWHDELGGNGVPHEAQSTPFQGCPNVNEALWYLLEGDAQFVTNGLFAMNGHLQSMPGIWIKKKKRIMKDHGITDPNYLKNGYPSIGGVYTDWRTQSIISPLTPKAMFRTLQLSDPDDTGNYFFLPALDRFYTGSMDGYMQIGCYWTSSANVSSDSSFSFVFSLYGPYMQLSMTDRRSGNKAVNFE